MIASRFDGYNNQTLMDVQHKTYGDMIGWLFGSARRRYLDAGRLLNVETDLTEALRGQTTFDHRTLQGAHDLIAAYFRFAHDDGGQLRFDESEQPPLYEIRIWRSWTRFFRDEVRDLLQDDEFTLGVLYAAVYANQDTGTAAEQQINLFLEDRYRDRNFGDPPKFD